MMFLDGHDMGRSTGEPFLTWAPGRGIAGLKTKSEMVDLGGRGSRFRAKTEAYRRPSSARTRDASHGEIRETRKPKLRLPPEEDSWTGD